MTREQLAQRIAEVALLHGDFTLRSGRKSTYYLDKYRFETQPDCLLELGKMIAARIPADAQRIAGPELGAVPLAASAAMQCGKPCIFVRNQKKEYGSARQIEGLYNSGEKIVLIEDIVTSGGQVIEAARALQDVGLEVLKVIVVIDREEGGREAITNAGIIMDALFTTTDLGIQK